MTLRILFVLLVLTGTAHADIWSGGEFVNAWIALGIAIAVIVGAIWLARRVWRGKR
jgi:hypothetical protein